MECPVGCPVFKENLRLKEEAVSLKQKHKEDIDKIRQMLADKAKE